MSTATTAPVAPPRTRVVSEPVTLIRAVRSEWIKFRTLRSTVAVLAAAAIGMVVVGLIVAYNTRHISSNIQANDLAPAATLQGYYLGQLLIGALGVLFVSSEYSTGSIRSSLAAVPTRLPVLWAKLIVFVSVTLVTMEIASLGAFLAGQALISHYRTGYSLGDPGALRVVLGTGLYLTLVGVLGGALGWIIRSTPGALVGYVALILVVPVALANFFGSAGKHLAQYLPTFAGSSFITTMSDLKPALSPGAGLITLIVWVLLGVAASAVVLRRRDA